MSSHTMDTRTSRKVRLAGGSLRGLVRGALTVSLLAATMVYALGGVAFLMDGRTMVVTSGSMEPTIRPGDAVIIRGDDGGYAVGDVVTFSGASGQMTTHRVISTKKINGRTFLQTQGDANATPDVDLVAVEAVAGRVAVVLPWMGYALQFSTTRTGMWALIGLPLLVLLVQEVGGLLGGGRNGPQSDRPNVRRGGSNVTALAEAP